MICPKCKSPDATEIQLFSSVEISCKICTFAKEMKEVFEYKIIFSVPDFIEYAPITITIPKFTSNSEVGCIKLPNSCSWKNVAI